MSVWVGIDPGQKGGICAIDENQKLKVYPMPVIHDLNHLLKKWEIKHAFLEKSQAMPKQGVSSMFNYGVSYGMLQGLLIANNVSHTLIKPMEWQKLMFQGTAPKKNGIKRNPKDRAIEAANRIFCKTSDYWLANSRCRKPHDGMIDSALIAEACRRMIG